jgi:hypothetical protein
MGALGTIRSPVHPSVETSTWSGPFFSQTQGTTTDVTIEITTATLDRLRALGASGISLEDVVVAALDAYESEQVWTEAEAAAASETSEERAERQRAEADVDAWMGTQR